MATKPTPLYTLPSEADKGAQTPVSRPFGKANFIAMGICLVMIVVGFALMTGPGSSPETGFNPDIFSTRRIVVGPTIAFLGFLLMAFAIIIKPDTFSRLRGRRNSIKQGDDELA